MNDIATRLPERHTQAHRRLPIWLPLALLTLGSAAAVAQTYTAIDCPESFDTEARGINDRGDIVGVCEDANGRHGFLLRKGVFTLIDAPGAPVLTLATGINNRGDVVGHYLDDEAGHGFLIRHGHFTHDRRARLAQHLPAGYRRTRADRWLLRRKRRGLSRFHAGFARFPGHRVPGRHGRGCLSHQQSHVDRRRLLRHERRSSRVPPEERNLLVDRLSGRRGHPSVWNQRPRSHRRRLERRPRMSGLFCERIPSHPARVHKPRVSRRARNRGLGHQRRRPDRWPYLGEDEAFHGFLREPKDQ